MKEILEVTYRKLCWPTAPKSLTRLVLSIAAFLAASAARASPVVLISADVGSPYAASASFGVADAVLISSPSGSQSRNVKHLAQTADGNLHAILLSNSHEFIHHYESTDGGATWSALSELSGDPPGTVNAPAVASHGNDLFAFWREFQGGNLYFRKRSGSTWDSIETVPLPPGSSSPCCGNTLAPDGMTVGGDGTAHVAYSRTVNGYNIMYTSRSTSGIWSDPIRISTGSQDSTPTIVTDSNNFVHVVYWKCNYDFKPCELLYTNNTSGSWSTPEPFLEPKLVGGGDLAAGKDGKLIYAWTRFLVENGQNKQYAFIAERINGEWGPAQKSLFDADRELQGVRVGLDKDNNAHLLAIKISGPGYCEAGKILYTHNVNGVWSTPVDLPNFANSLCPTYSPFDLVLDRASEKLHYIWNEAAPIYSAYFNSKSIDAPPTPPRNLVATPQADRRIQLTWDISFSTEAQLYRVYWDSGTGTVDYNVIRATITHPDTVWISSQHAVGVTYKFGLRCVDQDGVEEQNINVVASAVVVDAPPPSPILEIKIPRAGRKVYGNMLLVMANILQPAGIKAVKFQYKALAASSWSNITPADTNHPNPDFVAPYFVHWNVVGFTSGVYDLRVIALDGASVAIGTSSIVSVTVDSQAPDLEENALGGSITKKELLAQDTAHEALIAGDHPTEVSVRILVASGTLNQLSDILTVVSDPVGVPSSGADEHAAGPPIIDISLQSGQEQFGKDVTLLFAYKDFDDDGVLDGSGMKEEDLEIKFYDFASGTWRADSTTTIDRVQNVARVETSHFSVFGLFSPAAADLSDVLVYPVPWVPNDSDSDNGKPFSAGDATSGIIFENLTSSVKIQVFTLTGELAWETVSDGSGGKIQWNVRNRSGHEMATGGYFAVITDTASGMIVVRKIAVIR